ncbi:hypothetical protein SAMN02745246_03366 [Leeuwenhoekiella marinoflava DSM 3653]|uniref:Uncharacterized protein n=3 Tax=Leeuwenhoekiella marinoflava TaxID=988 RepID=A0A4Q0PJI2_9FLAO|nr:hypothetical protein DSL99_2970 [Leeuwenhoekiella marinoflava]SHF77774.1 hypothetical protein SAMN02745246_03366 [Leeuwenhoekiella marinoflava DSM 3653]
MRLNMNIIYISRLACSILFIFTLLSCSSSDNTDDVIIESRPTPEENIVQAVLSIQEVSNIDTFNAIVHAAVTDDGNGSISERGIYLSTTPDSNEGDKYLASSVKGSGEFTVSLTGLKQVTTYYAKPYAVNEAGVVYGDEVNFKTLIAESALFNPEVISISGAHDIFVEVELIDRGDLPITEMGVVWGTEEVPTIDNNKIIHATIEDHFKQRITDLEEQSVYFIRPYKISDGEAVYGRQMIISTIPEGNFTWSFNGTLDLSNPIHARIKSAFDEATWYFNNFTSITKHVTVNYSPGTPTANANFDGWINMGPVESYQRTGTALHEMAHSVGVGTHWKYDDLFTDNRYNGERAAEIIQLMSGDDEEYIRKSGVHFWPYGINGAHEDTGEEDLYITHCLILQGMKTDGLPSN